MASKQFLGKPVPSHKARPVKKRQLASPRWFAVLVIPVIACGALLSLQKNSLQQAGVGERSTGNALSMTLADSVGDAAGAAAGGAVTTATTTSLDSTKFCDAQAVRDAFLDGNNNLKALFPIVPNYLNGMDSYGADIDPASASGTSTYCSPPYWGREVGYLFIYKGLAILNWLAEALAIILTLYAGTLYIMGAFNEKNVTKAKTILIGAYVGLIIVFLAKTLVYSTINLTVKGSAYTLVGRDKTLSPPPIPGIGGTPAPGSSQ